MKGATMQRKILWKIVIACLIILLLHTNNALAGIGVKPTITELEVAPGEIATGLLRVANGSKEPVLVKVEIEDWLKLKTGESPVGVEDWLNIEQKEFELDPMSYKDIGYEVVAPEGIDGELVAMVFFASAVPGGGTLNITSRFGVSVYAGIKGTEIVDAEIENIMLDDSKLVVVVKNKGNVHLRPSGRILIKDSEGQLIDELKIPYHAVIFAGKTHYFPVDLSKTELSSGDYNIEAIFDTGNIYSKNKTFKKIVDIYVE